MKATNGHGSAKNTAGRAKLIRMIGVVIILIAVLASAALVLKDKIAGTPAAPQNGTDSANADQDPFAGITADEVLWMGAYSDGLAVLTGNQTRYYGTNGEYINKNEHNYTSPVLCVNGKNALLYDLGGTSLRLEKNGSIYSTRKLPATVTCAAVGKTFNYAYVLNSYEGFQSHLYVNSYREQLQFEWGCASDYISELCLSDNGRQIAVGLFSVKNTERISKVLLFSFQKSEAVMTAEFPEMSIYKIVFLSSGTLAVYTDNGVFTVNTSTGEKTKLIGYSSEEIKDIAALNAGVGVTVQNKFGNEHNEIMTFFSKNAAQTFEHSYTEKVVTALSSAKYAGVVFKNRAEIYDTKNRDSAIITFEETCRDAAMYGRDIYILTISGIHHYSVSDF